MENHNPHIKFSIVTPTYNADKHLDQTISSVLSQQGDLDVEYIIVDNESTDNTLAIAEDYKAQLGRLNSRRRAGQLSMKIVSKKDNGMYEAINRGFSMATGEIFAWINADDIYQPDAFTKVASVFSTLPEVKWLKGITSYIDERRRKSQHRDNVICMPRSLSNAACTAGKPISSSRIASSGGPACGLRLVVSTLGSSWPEIMTSG